MRHWTIIFKNVSALKNEISFHDTSRSKFMHRPMKSSRIFFYFIGEQKEEEITDVGVR